MQQKHVLLVGDSEHRDFQEAVAWLDEHTRLSRESTIARARDFLGQGDAPDATVIAQSRPGQFPSRDVESLHIASPLSRLVALLGSWCEGEMRTGRPWPGVTRVMWHQWRPRMIPQLGPYRSTQPATWSLPRTANLAEQMAATTEVTWPRREGLIAIHARTYRDYEAIGTACGDAGYSTAWCAPAQTLHASGFAAAIVDGVSAEPLTVELIRGVAEQLGSAPVIALLDYVRRQDFQRALAAGAAAVVSKPLLIYDVLWHLDDLLGASPQHQAVEEPTRTGRPVTSAA